MIDFPYKRSNLTILPRERFFAQDIFAFAEEEASESR